MILLFATCFLLGLDKDCGKNYTKEEVVEVLKSKYPSYFEDDPLLFIEEIILNIFEKEWILQSNNSI